eukprot:GHVU01006862.1.p1 GENE.GHVU01006862.1~~GHVU01006862.1.p1  ORF type:complete len:259 (-),score=16.98 GHVU01006862.1:920-1696(-)
MGNTVPHRPTADEEIIVEKSSIQHYSKHQGGVQHYVHKSTSHHSILKKSNTHQSILQEPNVQKSQEHDSNVQQPNMHHSTVVKSNTNHYDQHPDAQPSFVHQTNAHQSKPKRPTVHIHAPPQEPKESKPKHKTTRAMSLSCQRELGLHRKTLDQEGGDKGAGSKGHKMNQLFQSDDEYYQKILDCLEVPQATRKCDDRRHILAPRVKGDSDWERMRLWMMWSIRNSIDKEDVDKPPEKPEVQPRRKVRVSQSLDFGVP